MKLSEVNPYQLNSDLIKKIFFNIDKETYDYADYIIVYGCHIKLLLDERLKHVLSIAKNKKFNKIVLTGGIGINGDFNESEYMVNYLKSHGISEDKMIVENKSTTTEENNVNVLNLLGINLLQQETKIALVTQEFHMLRIQLHWKRLINNPNIRFYYDYVDNSEVSYEKMISKPELLKTAIRQVEKTKKFIREGTYADFDIDEIPLKGEKRIEFKNVKDFPKGTLYHQLADAYSYDKNCKKAWDTMWKEYDEFFYSHPEITDKYSFVTVLDGEPIGHISWDPRHRPDYVEIGHNCIITKQKGKGYGHIQLAEAIRRIKEYDDLKKIIVSTNEQMLPAQRNYESVGFKKVGERENIETPFSGKYVDYEITLKNERKNI